MKPCAHPRCGAVALSGKERGERSFTLLEMCMVLFVIALLLGVMMPAMQSALVEQTVRRDAHQLALDVKIAMIESAEQNRAYTVELTSTTMALHPAIDPTEQPSDAAGNASTSQNSAAATIDVTDKLDAATKLLAPDPQQAKNWVAMPPTPWLFRPGELCPASRVRLTRGDAWLEMSFNALTGNVEDETTYFP